MEKRSKEKRERRLSIEITRSELYMISRKAKSLGLSRPDMIVDAVIKYEKDEAQKQIPDQKKVTELLESLPEPVYDPCKSCQNNKNNNKRSKKKAS